MTIRFGHLYVADMNPRIRPKPGKVRPVVVVQSQEVIAAESPGIVIVPTTTNVTEENPLRVHLPAGAAGNVRASDVLIDQVHTLDRSLFRKELGRVPRGQMLAIIAGLALLLGHDPDADL